MSENPIYQLTKAKLEEIISAYFLENQSKQIDQSELNNIIDSMKDLDNIIAKEVNNIILNKIDDFLNEQKGFKIHDYTFNEKNQKLRK